MRTLTTTLTLLGLLTACTGDSVTPDGSDDTDVVSPDPTCDPPSATTCDNHIRHFTSTTSNISY